MLRKMLYDRPHPGAVVRHSQVVGVPQRVVKDWSHQLQVAGTTPAFPLITAQDGARGAAPG
jgi:hypothetical protein